MSITVSAATLVITPNTLPGATKNTVYATQNLTATGGTAPYTFKVSSGSLPTGLVLDSASGVLSGTTTEFENTTFDITVTDTYASVGTQGYSIEVRDEAPIAGAVTTTIAANSSATPINLILSAGTATSVAVITEPTHGTAVVSGTSISYTPAAGYAGLDSFTYTASNATGTSTAATVSITVEAPTLTISETGVVDATIGTTYQATFSATGGTAPYTFSNTGTLPTGLALDSVTGILSGTPTAMGTFDFKITVTDSSTGTGPFTATQNYSIRIADKLPLAKDINVNVAANSTDNPITLLLSDGAAISVAVVKQPKYGTATAKGTTISYTPNKGYAGTDTFTHTASNATGTSNEAMVTITVDAPTLAISVTGLVDATIGTAYQATFSATGGTAPYKFSNTGNLPIGLALDSATGVLSGTPSQIEKTSFVIEAEDIHGFKANSSHKIEVKQMQPVASDIEQAVEANSPVDVDLTQNAIGGPFTAANFIALSPENAGTVTIRASNATSRMANGNISDGGFIMTFTPAASFSGIAVATYTLSNTIGTSAQARVTFNVAERSDLSKDPEVIGLVNAQANAARRFSSTQISNFNRRMESLHRDGYSASNFDLNLAIDKAPSKNVDAQDQFSISPSMLKQPNIEDQVVEVLPIEPVQSAFFDTTTTAYNPLAIWANGTINYGRATQERDDSEYRFTTSGVSAGMDYCLNDLISIGSGLGYGHDNSRIGDHGSKSTGDSVSLIVYSTIRPMSDVFIDSLIGYGNLSFDSKRYVSRDGSFATGSRDGHHYFGSITTGMEFYRTSWMWSPYGRIELSRAQLDQFSETATGFNAVQYFKQNVSSANAVLGFRGQGSYVMNKGTFMPKLRLEYRHSLQNDDKAKLAYADLADVGPVYFIDSDNLENYQWMLGLGTVFALPNGLEFVVEYGTDLDRDASKNQTIQLGINVPF